MKIPFHLPDNVIMVTRQAPLLRMRRGLVGVTQPRPGRAILAAGVADRRSSRAQRGAPNADESRPCSRFGHPARAGSHAASMSPKAGHGAHPRRAIVAAREGGGFKGFAALACSWQIGTNSPGAKAPADESRPCAQPSSMCRIARGQRAPKPGIGLTYPRLPRPISAMSHLLFDFVGHLQEFVGDDFLTLCHAPPVFNFQFGLPLLFWVFC